MQAVRKFARVSAVFCAIVAVPAAAQLASLFRPDVPTIGLAELLAVLEDGEGAGADGRVLLVDVRSAEEVGVSMIPGAITQSAYEKDAAAYHGYRIVPYCTVGVRSARYTGELLKNDVDAVNFEGSIIAWVEAGLPLVTPSGEPTRRVHTWSPRYGVPPGYEQVTR